MKDRPRFDHSKLRGRIKEKLGNETIFAEALNISNASVSSKLNGNVPFSIFEIDVAVEILEIPTSEIYDYFFTRKVENNSTVK